MTLSCCPLSFHAGTLLLCGGLVNGPYALITTAVSADLVITSVPFISVCLFHMTPAAVLDTLDRTAQTGGMEGCWGGYMCPHDHFKFTRTFELN